MSSFPTKEPCSWQRGFRRGRPKREYSVGPINSDKAFLEADKVSESICPGMSRRWHLNMPHRIYPLRMRPFDDTRPREARRPLNDTRPRKVSRPVRMTRDSSSGGYYGGRYGGNYGGYYGGYYVGPSSWRYDLPAYTSMPRRDRYSIGPGGSTGFSFGGGFGGGMMGMSYGR
jgi:hypothetical protein